MFFLNLYFVDINLSELIIFLIILIFRPLNFITEFFLIVTFARVISSEKFSPLNFLELLNLKFLNNEIIASVLHYINKKNDVKINSVFQTGISVPPS